MVPLDPYIISGAFHVYCFYANQSLFLIRYTYTNTSATFKLYKWINSQDFVYELCAFIDIGQYTASYIIHFSLLNDHEYGRYIHWHVNE